MNIRQVPGKLELAIQSFPHIVPASQALFLAVEMLVPATDRRGLGGAKEHPSYAHPPRCPRRRRRGAQSLP
jgi:hypothetical protein